MPKCIVIEVKDEEHAAAIRHELQVAETNGFIDPPVSITNDWHTPHELYEHRYTLYRAMIFNNRYTRWNSWRSALHHDGTMFEDSFIVGVNLSNDQTITYHLPMSWWDKFDGITTYTRAPEWDGTGPEAGLALLNAYVDFLQQESGRLGKI